MDIRSLILLYYLLNNTIYSTALITSVVTVTVTAQQQQPQQTQASASSLSSSSSSYTNKTQLQHDTLTQTNSYRQQHNASALKWNISLAIYAQNWADRCLWKHSGGPNGENLAEGFRNVTGAIAAWAREGKDYDYSKPTGFSEETGHFTQLVWKATGQVGCAAANCSKNDATFRENGGDQAFGWFFVCEYWPPGNVVGDRNKYFEDNVDPMVLMGVSIEFECGVRLGIVMLVLVLGMIVL